MMPTPIIFLGVLSVLVLIHEFGHYAAARLFGIKVEEFAFGLPFTRALISVKIGETKYSIYPLLFGGFVKLHGEETEEKVDRKRSFFDRGKKQRVIVIAAGVVMNFILAFAIFAGIYTFIGLPKKSVEKVVIADVIPGSPADKGGLKQFDRVVKVEDKEIVSTEQFVTLIKSWSGLEVNVTVDRGETTVLLEGLIEKSSKEEILYLTPRVNPPKEEGALGVAVTMMPFLQVEKCPLINLNCIVRYGKVSVETTGMWIGKVVEGLRGIGKSLAERQVPKDLSGPVGIYNLTGEVAQAGALPLIQLMAILSVNLGVFNILPIPALDGGRILFILIEWVRRKKLSAEFEQKVNSIGMTVLLGLIVLITMQDLIRINILEKIRNLIPHP